MASELRGRVTVNIGACPNWSMATLTNVVELKGSAVGGKTPSNTCGRERQGQPT
jgi:hypothetical protein